MGSKIQELIVCPGCGLARVRYKRSNNKGKLCRSCSHYQYWDEKKQRNDSGTNYCKAQRDPFRQFAETGRIPPEPGEE